MEESLTHWVNNFWGDNDAGYKQLMQRMHYSRQTCEELRQYYRERMTIEHEYARKLTALSRKALGSNEIGDMKSSLETVRSTTKNAAATHETVSRQLAEQLLAPLEAFTVSVKGRSKTVEETMGQLTRAKASQNANTEKVRNKYVTECNRISGYQASQNLLMGRELDKNNQKLDRASYQVEGLQRQYQNGLRALTQIMETWNAEWRVSCDKLEQLEEERLSFIKSSLWAYANAFSASCVADDVACESVRLSLERCEPLRDLETFCKEKGTGSRIQEPPEFVNFLQGFSRESDEVDGHYHMANFAYSLSESAIPDLGAPSPSLSQQLSPKSNQSQPSLASSPNTSPSLGRQDEYREEKAKNLKDMSQQTPQLQVPQSQFQEQSKKRRSWAMPFRRKNNSADKPVSALDDPISESINSAFTFKPIQQPIQQAEVAPHEQTSTTYDLQSKRSTWGPISAKKTSSDPNEDPLLMALERLKTPGLKARPRTEVNANNNGHKLPYGNESVSSTGSTGAGTAARFAGEVNSPKRIRSPVRKQVGSGITGYPTHTSDGRKVVKHSRAQFDYRAAIPEEVTFRKGDLLLITLMQEDGWWDCEVANSGGAHGLAPSNFLTDAQ